MQVEDRARRFDGVADGGRAGGETLGEELLVFEDKALKLAFLACDRVEGFDVELPEALDIDRATLLQVGQSGWN